ncbi:winged helix-turn-helix transcriptional regulator [Actinacidiphila glaucinigra]|uniref:winged helix-turn-helix transcriptional regulator n=1 Tax=Actinacidiphila glaucinigra TaxID=235986 RepID=UPI0029B30A36|nr:helix-turn-helix domain-containing protein [Streptomyces sp. PA03-3a]
MSSAHTTGGEETVCSIARTLEVVGDKWTLLVLREAALRGVTRFADFRRELGIAPDLLTGRLGSLVTEGIMEKRPYREPGSRTRYSYHLTPAGEELRLILAALQQWGDVHRTPARGPGHLRRSGTGGRPVSVAFVDDAGTVLPLTEVEFTPSQGGTR